MRHGRAVNRLGRHAAHRKALVRNLLTSLVEKERIETTLPKAKVLKSWADRLITLGKRGDLHARRMARRVLYTDDAVSRLFGWIAPRFAKRQGGYTRLFKLGFRRGDAAPLALVEFLPGPAERPKARPKDKKEKASSKKS